MIIIATGLGHNKKTFNFTNNAIDLIEDADIKGEQEFTLKKDIAGIENHDTLY